MVIVCKLFQILAAFKEGSCLLMNWLDSLLYSLLKVRLIAKSVV